MRRPDFDAMVRAMTAELPPGFLDGIDGIEVTGKTLPHPLRRDVYTLGECVPNAFTTGEPLAALQSRVLLHHGSFAALARITPGFDWRAEAWETLTHEVRHHLEWRARIPDLEALDDAVEANYARAEGEAFPALFFLDGERLGENVYKVEDDVFLDVRRSRREKREERGERRAFVWHGRAYRVQVPGDDSDILFLSVDGVEPEPAGELVLVIRRRSGLRDLWHRTVVAHHRADATTAGIG